MLEMATSSTCVRAGLSADQKQKISLGRGLVRPDVAAVLFDEPLTVIDPHLKVANCAAAQSRSTTSSSSR